MFVIILLRCGDWNLQCFFIPWWLEQTCNRTNSKLWSDRQFCTFLLSVSLCWFSVFWWPENAISGHHPFWLTKLHRTNIDVWKIIIVMWYVKSVVSEFTMLIRGNVLSYKCVYSKFWRNRQFCTYNLERFLLLIFSVLVTRKRDFWTMITLAKKKVVKNFDIGSLLSSCDMWNQECRIFAWFLEQTFSRKTCLVQLQIHCQFWNFLNVSLC